MMQWNATYESNEPFFHKASMNIRLEYERALDREEKKKQLKPKDQIVCASHNS